MARDGALLTLPDWDAMPEDDEFRTEVVEGVLIVSARPVLRHHRAVFHLAVALERGLPPRFRQVQEVDVVLRESPLTVRSPDIVLIPVEVAERNPMHVVASDVVLAVEVHSEATAGTDRVTKRVEYAAAGIAHYWLVDPDGPRLMAFRLQRDTSELVGEWAETA